MITTRPAACSRPPTPDRSDWRDVAVCRRADTRVFYPDSDRQARAAKAWCAACPVRPDCLEHALSVGERWGVWGGATEDERRALRRARRETRQVQS